MTANYTTPAIMSAPMVRALLNGRKTQTRRLVTSQWANLKMHLDQGERCFIWVRETWLSLDGQKYYRASTTPDGNDIRKEYGARWKPSIHMPRWASRLTLELTNVRVERLCSISEQDAIAEGILRGDPLPEVPESEGFIWSDGVGDLDSPWNWTRNPVQAYCNLWSAINGPRSWDENPWVWVLEFLVHRQNIDALLADWGIA